MTNDVFRQLLKETLEPVNQKLDDLTKEQESLKQELADVQNTIETRILPPLAYIETTVKSYADSYMTNKSNIERLDGRLTRFEEDANIIVPPELTVQR